MVSVEVKQHWNQQSFAVRQAIEKKKKKKNLFVWTAVDCERFSNHTQAPKSC